MKPLSDIGSPADSSAEYREAILPSPWVSASTARQLGRQQTWNDVRTSAPLLLVDMLTVSLALMAASTQLWGWGEYLPAGTAFWLGTVTVTLLVQHVHGLYPACGLPLSREVRSVLRTCLIVLAGVAVGIVLYLPEQGFPFVGFIIFGVLLIGALPVIRLNTRKLFSQFDWWAQPVLIVGSEDRAQALFEKLRASRREGLRPLGITFDPEEYWASAEESQGYVGPVTELEAILVENRTCRVAIADPETARNLSFYSYRGVPHVAIPTELTDHPTERTQMREGVQGIELSCRSSLTSPTALLAKRLLDIGLIALSAPLLVPVLVAIGLAIKLDTRGPVIYGQKRVGRHGRPFRAWKFRSMVPNADEHLRNYLLGHPELRTEWDRTHKLKADPRVTRVGTFLRRTSLDELPQLWNVIVGEMSLVGPRPIVDSPDYDREYIDEHPQVYDLYTLVRPGITGLWQVSGRNLTTYEKRVDLDRYYLQNWSCMLDIYILWRTVKTALLREGAY